MQLSTMEKVINVIVLCGLFTLTPTKAAMPQERVLDISSLFGTGADAAIDVLLVSYRSTAKILGFSTIALRDRIVKDPFDGGKYRLTNIKLKGIDQIERAGKSEFSFTRLKSRLGLSNLQTTLNFSRDGVTGGLFHTCRNSTIDLVLEAKIAFPLPIPYLALDSLIFKLGGCSHHLDLDKDEDVEGLDFLVDPLAQGIAKVVADKAKEIFNTVAGSYSFIG